MLFLDNNNLFPQVDIITTSIKDFRQFNHFHNSFIEKFEKITEKNIVSFLR